jgi:hypothetical protein
MLYQTHQKLIHEQLQNAPAVVDAVLLFKVTPTLSNPTVLLSCSETPPPLSCEWCRQIWLRQRGMHVGADTMNGFLASMLLLHLLQSRKVNREMSSYQIFRAALDFIGTHTTLPQ